MAKPKLSPDYIKWVLTLNASQAQEEIHKLEKSNKELQKSINADRKAMADLEAQGKKGSDQWNNLRASIKGYTNEISLNNAKIAELSKRLDLSSMSMNQLKRHLKELQREFNNTSKKADPSRYKELQKQIEQTRKAMQDATKATSTLGKAFAAMDKYKEILAGFFWGIGASILQLVTGSFRNAFNLVVDFEAENARLAAILGTTRDGIKDMEAAARQLGATTSYSAAQATSLQIELAKLGFGKDQIIAMEGAVLNFAKAVGTDLAPASAFAGAALRIFNKDAKDMEEVLATFAVATTKTALDFSKLETSLSIVGPVANSFGFTIEDTTALLGALANAGFDASSAATATRNILLNLADANGDLAKALGGPVKNADDLAKGLKKLQSEGVDLAKALELTDKRSVAAFSVFMNNAGSLGEIKEQISGVTEEFNQMATTMADNVSGAMAGLQSASEELVLKIAGGTNGPIKDLINALTKMVQGLGTAIEWMGRYSGYLKAAAVGIGTYVGLVKLAHLAQLTWAKAKAAWIAVEKLYHAAIVRTTAAMKLLEGNTFAARRQFYLLKQTMSGMPWVAIVSAVMAIGAAFVYYTLKGKEMTDVTKEIDSANKSANERYAEQRSRIMQLVKVAESENASLNARKKAIDKLNETIPGYNAQLDATTGKYRASKKALDEYLSSLEKKIRYEALKEQYSELVKDEELKRQANESAQSDAEQERRNNAAVQTDRQQTTYFTSGGVGGGAAASYGYFKASTMAQDHAKTTQKDYDAAHAKSAKLWDYMQRGVSEGRMDDSGLPESPGESGGGSGGGGDKGKGKHTPAKDIVKEATAEAEELHRKNMLAIEEQKQVLSENEYIIEQNLEMMRYCEEIDEVLTALSEKTASANTDQIKKIEEARDKNNLALEKAIQTTNATVVKMDAALHQKRLDALKTECEEEIRVYDRKLQDQEITQGEYEILRLKAERGCHADRLAELQRYLQQTQECTYISETERKKIVEKTQAEIRQMQSQVLTDTGKWQEKLRSLLKDPSTAAGMAEAYELQRKNIIATYDLMKKEAGEATETATALEAEKNRRLQILDLERREQIYQLQEAVGLSWEDEFDRELTRLQAMHAKGLLSEKQYQKARLQAGVDNAKKYYDYYYQLAGSTVSAIQNAEIAQVEAKYDVLIQQAKNNGEETALLEEEKENKKLEIQKRYADVDFAVKIAQIIADTSVSIMKAFSQLGPIGGAVAAALLTATGVAQVVTAKAQRDQVKNMEPGRTASSGNVAATTPTATRQLTGFSEGGYTGAGGRYDVAGVVHRGEYVIPQPIMADPRVVDAVGMIEAIRLHKLQLPASASYSDPRTSYTGIGYADGGFTGVASIDAGEFRAAVAEFKDAAKNLRAYVLWKDIDRAGKEMARAQSPFRK